MSESDNFKTVIKRLLSTPPKPHADSKVRDKKRKPGSKAPDKAKAGKAKARKR